MKRMSSKHQRNSVGRPAGRANLKGQSCTGGYTRARVWRGSASVLQGAVMPAFYTNSVSSPSFEFDLMLPESLILTLLSYCH